MATYIVSAAQLSPQPTFQSVLPACPLETVGLVLRNVEPDYKQFIPPARLRRMSRVLKMGLATSALCVERSPFGPDAVVVGTGQGCSVELEQFMRSYEAAEELLSPIPFVNSGHNTLAGQLSLYHQIKGYNTTYLQEGAAFESALTDAALLLDEGDSQCALVGAFDEVSDLSFRVFSRLGEIRKQAVGNLQLLRACSPGTVMGEGVGFFCLAGQPGGMAVEVLACETRPSGLNGTAGWLAGVLAAAGLSFGHVDALYVGRNGDQRTDEAAYAPVEALCPAAAVVAYKHLCGEYPTAHSFALWMAVNQLCGMELPACAVLRNGGGAHTKTVLLYNATRTAECAILLRK